MGYGYAPNGIGEWHIPIEDLSYLGVNLYSGGKYMGVNGKWDSHWIDCGTNEELFLALAALNNETDKNQWFVCYSTGVEDFWYLCKRHRIEDCYHHIHKATPKELIKHFKDK